MQQIQYTPKRLRRCYGAEPSMKVLTVLFVLLLVSASAALGVFLADRVVDPFLQKKSAEAVHTLEIPTAAKALPDGSIPEKTQAPQFVSKQLCFDTMTFYYVQLGAYSNLESALEAAAQFQRQGDAGFVQGQTRQRVFAQVYTDAARAGEALELRIEKGQDCYLHSLSAGGLSMQVEGESAQVESLENAYRIWWAAQEALCVLWENADAGTVDVSDGAQELTRIGEKLCAAARAMQPHAATVRDDGGVMEGLIDLCSQAGMQAKELSQAQMLTGAAFCARVKYLGISWAESWCAYIDEVTRRITAAQQLLSEQ